MLNSKTQTEFDNSVFLLNGAKSILQTATLSG